MDEEEKKDVEMFDIRQVLEEIKEYRMVPREEILEFLLQDKKDDTAFFFYKNMLLQLVELDEHFVNMIEKYDRKLQYGPELAPFLHKILNAFCYGDTEELRKIIEFASDITQLNEHDLEREEIKKLTSEWRSLTLQRSRISVNINKNEKNKEEKRKKLEGIKSEINSKGSDFRGIRQFFEKRKLQKQKLQLEGELSAIEGENTTLQEEFEQKCNEVEANIQQIREVFSSIGMQELGEKIIGDFPYVGCLSNFFDYYRYIPKYLKEFQDDVFSMTQFMSCLSSCVKAIDEGKDLKIICRGIRKQMRKCNCRTNGAPWEVEIRKRDLYNNGDFIGEMSSKSTTISEDFEKLSNQYKEALAEKDETEFIKKCADLHFDFTRVHPFTDANGRTSRILLSMMLATRNHMLPSLYSTMYEKEWFYESSNTALRGDYSVIERDVFRRLGHFYPLVMPRIEKTQQGVSMPLSQDSIGIGDLETISNGVEAQERIDAINGMKNLAEKAQRKDKEALTEQAEK